MAFNFISVGVDVGSTFSFMTILSPFMEPIGNPFKIYMDNLDSIEAAIKLIKKAEKLWHVNSHIYMESTGIYHLPLFCYLSESGFEVFLLNPLITDSTKNSAIRKVKTDKSDSFKIASLGFNHKLKVSLMPKPEVFYLRSLTREYYTYSDEKTACVNRLSTFLHVSFPGYHKLFDQLTGLTSIAILKTFGPPQSILHANPEEVIALIQSTSKRGVAFASKKYELLISIAKDALDFTMTDMYPWSSILRFISTIEYLQNQMNIIETEINQFTRTYVSHPIVKQINLLTSLPGFQTLSAASIMAEIGDFSMFSKPKELAAYFGLDPSVKESCKFKATNIRMSKRGSCVARRVLFNVALSNVRKSSNGTILNPTLYNYYKQKTLSKKKKVVLGAIMHKLCFYIFAVLRDSKAFKIRSEEEHRNLYLKTSQEAA